MLAIRLLEDIELRLGTLAT